MDATMIGAYGLCVLGLATFGLAAWRTAFAPEASSKWRLTMLWVFGMAAAGVGAYGPAFLEPYGKFVEPILTMQKNPSPENVKAVMAKVGNGELPAEYGDLALAYAVTHPQQGQDMEAVLTAQSAQSKDPAGKQKIDAALTEVKGRKATAATLADFATQRGTPPEDIKKFEGLDRNTKTRLYDELKKRNVAMDKIRVLQPDAR